MHSLKLSYLDFPVTVFVKFTIRLVNRRRNEGRISIRVVRISLNNLRGQQKVFESLEKVYIYIVFTPEFHLKINTQHFWLDQLNIQDDRFNLTNLSHYFNNQTRCTNLARSFTSGPAPGHAINRRFACLRADSGAATTTFSRTIASTSFRRFAFDFFTAGAWSTGLPILQQ